MDNETQKKLFDWVKDTAEKGGAWLEEELPAFATEIVAWHYWSSLAFMIFWLLMATIVWSAATYFFVSWLKRPDITRCSSGDESVTVGYGFAFAILGAVGLFMMLGASECGYQAIKAHVAPRLVILHYASSLVK